MSYMGRSMLRPYKKEGKLDHFNLSGGFHAAEKAVQAAQAFVDAFDRSGVRKPQVAGRAESFAGDECDASFFQEQL